MAVNLVRMTKRLQQIRVALAYTVEEAGKATGLDVHRLLSIESGDATPTGDEILILASLYDCDFRTLIDEALPPPAQQTDILFRRYGDAFTPEDRRAIQEFLHLCQIEASLERQLGLVNEAVHFEWSGTLFKAHGQQVAEALRTRLGYSDNEAPRDIYSDFRRIGIHIFRRKLVNNEISGLYIEDPVAGHCVLINYNEDIYRQRFSVAHEVAHAIFDSSEGMMLTFQPNSAKYDKNELKEIRANSFASQYLMPLTMLRRIPKVDESSAPEWAQKFRVSTAALAKALRDANLIDENMGKQCDAGGNRMAAVKQLADSAGSTHHRPQWPRTCRWVDAPSDRSTRIPVFEPMTDCSAAMRRLPPVELRGPTAVTGRVLSLVADN